MIPKRCSEIFSCSDSFKTVHFKFDRFDVEARYDYLVIGYPNRFDNYYDAHFGSVNIDFESPTEKEGLMLDGQQPTDIWVNAQSIPNFNIYFYRNVLKVLWFLFENSWSFKTLKSDHSVTESGVRMVMECRIPTSNTPGVFDVYNDDDFYSS